MMNEDDIINNAYAFLSDLDESNENPKSVKDRRSFFEITDWKERQARQKIPERNQIISVPKANQGGSKLLKATDSFLAPHKYFQYGPIKKTPLPKNYTPTTVKPLISEKISNFEKNEPSKPQAFRKFETSVWNGQKETNESQKVQENIHRPQNSPPQILKGRREFGQVLNKILKVQANDNRLSITRSIDYQHELEKDQKTSKPMPSENYDTIKTLKKNEIKNVLEVLYNDGPPKRPSFRGKSDIDRKRSERIVELRKIEKQAQLINRNSESIQIDDIENRQKQLMKGVTDTIRHKSFNSKFT